MRLSNLQLSPTQYSLTRVSPPRREPPQSFRRRGSLGKSKDELREIFNEFDEDKDGAETMPDAADSTGMPEAGLKTALTTIQEEGAASVASPDPPAVNDNAATQDQIKPEQVDGTSAMEAEAARPGHACLCTGSGGRAPGSGGRPRLPEERFSEPADMSGD